MRWMSAEDPGGLEEYDMIVRDISILVLILKPESQELAPVPAYIGGNTPGLLIVVVGILGPVETNTGVPVAVELLLHEQVSAQGIGRITARLINIAVNQLGLDQLIVKPAGR